MYQIKDIPPDIRDDLTKDTKNAIQSWIRDSIPINTALRYGKSHEYFREKEGTYEQAIIEARLISEAITMSSLHQDYIISRGLGSYDVNKIKNALDEKVRTGISPLLQDNGFTAVSYQHDIALRYTEYDIKGERYILVSSLQKGDTALFIGDESTLSNRKEGEILLQKSTPYYITGKKTYITRDREVIHQVLVEFLTG